MKITLKISLIAFSILLTTLKLHAAEGTFNIMILKGDCQVKKKNNSKLTKLIPGGAIAKGEYIKLDNSSYIALRHTTGRTVELTTAGLYSADSLEKKILAMKDDLFKKFVSFVVASSSTDLNNQLVNISSSRNISAGVSRSNNIHKNMIRQINPRNSLLIDKEIVFCWNKAAGAEEYLLHINDDSNQPVYIQAVKDTALKVEIGRLNIKLDKFYSWIVTSKTNEGELKSAQSFLFVSDTAKIHQIKDSYEALVKYLNLKGSALDNALIANFYDRNSVYYKAFEHYNKAAELSGYIPAYKNILDTFLNRIEKMAE